MTESARGNYSVEALANTILDTSEEMGTPLGPMKIQKLMYLMHGYYLALTGAPLVDEFFEAWQYGPVVPTIYHQFKEFGSRDIRKGRRASKSMLDPSTMKLTYEAPRITADDATVSKGGKVCFRYLRRQDGHLSFGSDPQGGIAMA
jgi:uncharacterized phage-associated protein